MITHFLTLGYYSILCGYTPEDEYEAVHITATPYIRQTTCTDCQRKLSEEA